jgi:hypothetical protein
MEIGMATYTDTGCIGDLDRTRATDIEFHVSSIIVGIIWGDLAGIDTDCYAKSLEY